MKENFFNQNKDIISSEKEIVEAEIESMKKGNEKIKEIDSLIDESFSERDAFFAKKALYLAKEIHEDQIQIDGRPYIEHPIDVAKIVIEEFKLVDRDTFITALLHDSLEDQSEKLFVNYMEKNDFFINSHNILGLKVFSSRFSNEIKELAFLEIRDNFGSSIAENVRRLSKPDFDGLVDSFPVEDSNLKDRRDIKNHVYKDYFKNVLDCKDEGVGIVKCADFFNNVSRNHLLENEEDRKRLADKYGPVLIEVVIPFFREMKETHPLYGESKRLLSVFTDIYNKDFSI